jgi:hypothetical protein
MNINLKTSLQNIYAPFLYNILKLFKSISIILYIITMAPSKNMDNPINKLNETVKPKRGRKSKQELMASLNMGTLIKKTSNENVVNENVVTICVSEIATDDNDITNVPNVYDTILNENVNTTIEEPKIAKKRGRKPKGGKIIQQLNNNDLQMDDKPNVILHLKCSMKDLQLTTQNNYVESYNFLSGKNDFNYEIIENENKYTTQNDNENHAQNVNNSTMDYECDYEGDCYNDEDDDASICKDVTKGIWKKIKQLEHNLHINNVNNKRSSCFWDTCEFDNPPIYIPKHVINGSYHVYGCFCSPECGVAYLMNENIDSSTKFERYHLFNNIYAKIYEYKKNVKPAPNPYYMLNKYYGNLTIQEYRSLLKNERLFLIVDKPLTRILPELHEDNDDFILNNKIIPSNNYYLKTKLRKNRQNKNSILNEKFGAVN